MATTSATAGADTNQKGIGYILVPAPIADITAIDFTCSANRQTVTHDPKSFSLDSTIIASGGSSGGVTWTRTTVAGWVVLKATVTTSSEAHDVWVQLYESNNNTVVAITMGYYGIGKYGRLTSMSVDHSTTQTVANDVYFLTAGTTLTGNSGTATGYNQADLVAGTIGVGEHRDFNLRQNIGPFSTLTASSGGWTHSTDAPWDLLEQTWTWAAPYYFDLRTQDDGADLDWQIDGVHFSTSNAYTATAGLLLIFDTSTGGGSTPVSLSASATVSASIVTALAYVQAVNAVGSVAASILTTTGKALSAAVSAAVSLAKDRNAALLAAAAAGTAALGRVIDRLMQAVSIGYAKAPKKPLNAVQWLPQNHLTILAWWDSSDWVSNDNNGTLVVSELVSFNNQVTRWRDRSDNGMDAFRTEGVDVTDPPLMVDVSGVAQFTSPYIAANPTGRPMRAPLNGKLPANDFTLVAFHQNLDGSFGTAKVTCGFGDYSTTGAFIGITQKTTGSDQIAAVHVGGGSITPSEIIAPTPSEQLVILGVESGQVTMHVNGEAGPTVTQAMSIDLATDPYFYLGAAGYPSVGNAQAPANVRFGHVMVIDGQLTTDQRQRLEGYLTSLNNSSQESLDPTHPYYATGRSFVPQTYTATSSASAAVSAGLEFPQAVSAAATVSAAAVTLAGFVRSLAASAAGSPAVSRAASLVRAAAVTGSPAVARSVALARSAASTATAAMTTSFSYLQSVVASATVTAVLATVRAYSRALAASATVTAVRAGSLNRIQAVASISSAAMSRAVSLARSVTATGAASVSRVMSRAVTAAGGVAVSLTALKAVLTSLAASATGSATMARLQALLGALTATASGAATMSRQIALGLAGGASVTATYLRRVARLLTASSTATATPGVAQFRDLSAAGSFVAGIVTALPSFARTFGRIVIRAATYGLSRLK